MVNKRVGVIGILGKWSTEVIADALETRTGFRLVIDMSDVAADLGSDRLLWKRHDLCELDGLVVKKITEEYDPNTLDRAELLRVAEAKGVRVFSPAESIIRLVDRLACTVTLRNGGIPMPETIVTEDPGAAFETVKRFGTSVFKPLYSTKARGMVLIEGEATASEIEEQIADFRRGNPMMYIQRKLNLAGRDLGLVFLAGEYLGAYARVAKGDVWNTTIHSGGKYAPFEPPPEVVEIAQRAQSLFNLDFTTVDVALTDEGPVVFEVSAFGGFKGAKDGIGIDAADRYADHIMKTLGQ
ncbi:MAG: ATP-grasp family protein [Flammeovirgaceae bacterium TMED32]|nr:ATP-grasp family protein [Rhodospirillaceae bacterium]OUU01249.1 MAG: ATP-grasp family protein [Flammeovirgaceae bacterium TMED32]